MPRKSSIHEHDIDMLEVQQAEEDDDKEYSSCSAASDEEPMQFELQGGEQILLVSQPFFRQVDFLWLFDPVMKFRDRQWEISENNLTYQDYIAMRALNRQWLTEFLRENDEHGIEKARQKFAEEKLVTTVEEIYKVCNMIEESWADERIDEEFKTILKTYDNGKYLEVDLVAHLEYFYNTLDCAFNTENPFSKKEDFPALMFTDSEESMLDSQSVTISDVDMPEA